MTAQSSKEAVGVAYSIESMRYAQAMTWRAIEALSRLIRPGMLESEARELGKKVLADLDMQRIWHPLLVRFGANTLKTFKERSDGDPVLGKTTSTSSTWAPCGKAMKVMRGRHSAPATTQRWPRVRARQKRCLIGLSSAGGTTKSSAWSCIVLPKNKRRKWVGC